MSSDPPSCRVVTSLTSVEPKPAAAGSCTGCPLVSIHRSSRPPPGWTVHSMSTQPESTDSAPYLTALVASSWIRRLMGCTAFGGNRKEGPEILT